MDELKFKAIFHAIRIDKEGESRVTFTIPMSDLVTAAQIAAMKEMELDVSISIGVE